jgi:hypothetical protein
MENESKGEMDIHKTWGVYDGKKTVTENTDDCIGLLTVCHRMMQHP